jgi:hypothetical protein
VIGIVKSTPFTMRSVAAPQVTQVTTGGESRQQ